MPEETRAEWENDKENAVEFMLSSLLEMRNYISEVDGASARFAQVPHHACA